MKIAIIGSGLSGLSLAWNLLQKQEASVTVFSEKIGGGASGISTGLLHPYAGEQGRRSWKATEAIHATRTLIDISQNFADQELANFQGVIRYAANDEQKEQFLRHISQWGDVELIEEGKFLIRSGITLHVPHYLKALQKACESRGGKFEEKKIHSLEELHHFDQVIIAAGAGVVDLLSKTPLQVKRIKGQLMVFRCPENMAPLEKGLLAKGYVVPHTEKGLCTVGATYERDFSDERPDYNRALLELEPKLNTFFPGVEGFSALECKAAVRVVRIGHYYPMAKWLDDRQWVMTAMGSRGLLYHAYVAEQLSRAVLSQDELCLNPELRIDLKSRKS